MTEINKKHHSYLIAYAFPSYSCRRFLQVEGAFVQGLGLFTLEEVRFSQTGCLLTTGPGTYKIPGCADIPVEFNVHLLRSAPNKHAICCSKVRILILKGRVCK